MGLFLLGCISLPPCLSDRLWENENKILIYEIRKLCLLIGQVDHLKTQLCVLPYSEGQTIRDANMFNQLKPDSSPPNYFWTSVSK